MSDHSHAHPHFYGSSISRHQQADYINDIVAKYQHEPVTDELLQKVYDELMMEKHKGNITIPFQVLRHEVQEGRGHREYIEVALDTRV